MRRRRRKLPATGGLTALALPAAMTAQAPLVGSITDAASGNPIVGVEVTIPTWGLRTVSDSAGHCRLVLAGGVYRLQARKIGYLPETRVLSVVVADTIHADLALTVAPLQLPELTAKAVWDLRYWSEFEQRGSHRDAGGIQPHGVRLRRIADLDPAPLGAARLPPAGPAPRAPVSAPWDRGSQ